jgi:TolC family type I secretion outer membrane protein
MNHKPGKFGRILTFSAAILIITAVAPAPAQETNGRLTVQRALDIALREHPSLKETRERMAAAQYQIGSSRAAYLPQLSYTGNFLYGNAFPSTSVSGGPPGISGAIGGNTTDFYTNRFSVSQLVYDFGKTFGQIDQSKANFQQRREDYSGNRQQVALDARTAYYGYLAAQRAVKVEQENVAQNQTLLKQAQGFYNVGLRAKIDVTKAEANLYDAEASLIRAKNAADLARVTLMTAMGLKTWPFTELEDVLDVTPVPLSLDELKAQALQKRPEILRNRYQEEFDQAGLKVARAGYFPTFSTLASYGWSSPNAPFSSGSFDNNTWWVGAGLTWPVFDGLLTYHNVRVARSNIQATLAGGEVLRQDVRREVEQAYLDLKSGWELVRATKKAVEAARENFRLAQGRYQVGVGSIIEVTDAQVQLSRTELRYVQALYDYKANEARLDKAIGKAF